MEYKITPGRRLDAITGALQDSNTHRLAAELEVDRGRLVLARSGRRKCDGSVLNAMESTLGVRSDWIRRGEEPVFVEGRSPGADVEAAVKVMLDYGAPRTGAVPLIDELDRPTEGSTGRWRNHASRGLVPQAGVLERGWYVVAQPEHSMALGCAIGDLVLLVDAEWFFARYTLGAGDGVVAVVGQGADARLERFTVVAGEASGAEGADEERAEGVTVALVSPDGLKVNVRRKGREITFVGTRLEAIAIRLERDLVTRPRA